MSEGKSRKRSKAYYRKSSHGGKKQKIEGNRLMPGIQGFLVMCNSNEMNAVRESYNILNEYADAIYGQGKSGTTNDSQADRTDQTGKTEVKEETHHSDTEDEDDLEAALRKEVEGMKAVPSELKRFQNCKTQAKNCIFIRSTVADPVKVAVTVMEDIASRQISRARYAARILPVVGTCKAHTPDITELAQKVLHSVFHSEANPPSSYTIVFKARNNNTTSCGKLSVISALTKVVKDINPSVTFTWSNFELAVLVEVVCTVCCLVVAPSYTHLRKYNLQELARGPKSSAPENMNTLTVEEDGTAEMKDVSVQFKTPDENINSKDAGESKSSQCEDGGKVIDCEKEDPAGKIEEMLKTKSTQDESINCNDAEESKSSQCVDEGKVIVNENQEDIVNNESISNTENCIDTSTIFGDVEKISSDNDTECVEKNI